MCIYSSYNMRDLYRVYPESMSLTLSKPVRRQIKEPNWVKKKISLGITPSDFGVRQLACILTL